MGRRGWLTALLVAGGVAGSAVVVQSGENGAPVATPTPTATSSASPACTTTFTTGGFDNTPYNGDNVRTAHAAVSTSGQVFCFASGTYAGMDLYTDAPSNMVTFRPADGATVTMGPITTNGTRNAKFQDFSGASSIASFTIRGANEGGGYADTYDFQVLRSRVGGIYVGNINRANTNILIQGNVLAGTTGDDGSRFKLLSNTGCPSGITVDGNEMSGGSTDGVQMSANCQAKISNNYIHDIGDPVTGSCGGPHCDGIQLVADTSAEIYRNLIVRVPTCITNYDGRGTDTYVHDNVCINIIGVGVGSAVINLGNTGNGRVEHNTIWGSTGSDEIGFGSKSGGSSTGSIARNNIVRAGVCTGCGDVSPTFASGSPNYNLCASSCAGANSLTGTPVFSGGAFASGTTLAYYALASGSPGKGAASDGLDIGVNP